MTTSDNYLRMTADAMVAKYAALNDAISAEGVSASQLRTLRGQRTKLSQSFSRKYGTIRPIAGGSVAARVDGTYIVRRAPEGAGLGAVVGVAESIEAAEAMIAPVVETPAEVDPEAPFGRDKAGLIYGDATRTWGTFGSPAPAGRR